MFPADTSQLRKPRIMIRLLCPPPLCTFRSALDSIELFGFGGLVMSWLEPMRHGVAWLVADMRHSNQPSGIVAPNL